MTVAAARLPLFVFVFLVAAAPGVGRQYRNEAMRVRSFEPPAPWQIAPQPSYPRLLCEYSHPDGGRLTLAAQRIMAGATAESLAQAAKPALEKQGFSDVKVTSTDGRVRLEAHIDGNRRFLKQLYLVDGNLAFVISLSANTINEPQMTRDFDWVQHTLVITPAEAPPAPDGGITR
jgi:hypothetical protein